jgi:hypothetical protein
MSADPRIAAPLDLRPVMHIFLRLAIAAVRSAMIDGHLTRGVDDLMVSSRRRTPRPAHAALNEAGKEVVRDRRAISLFMSAQFLLHLLKKFLRDNGGHIDRDPLRAISENPFAVNHFLAFAIGVCGLCYAIVIPHARIRFILQHGLDLTPVPIWPPRAGRNAALFQRTRDRDKSEVSTCEHLEDLSDDFRLLFVDDERCRCTGSFFDVAVAIDAVAVAAHLSHAKPVKPSACCALDDLGALVLGKNAQHLERHFVLGVLLIVLAADSDLLAAVKQLADGVLLDRPALAGRAAFPHTAPTSGPTGKCLPYVDQRL